MRSKENTICGIYCIENLINKKKYIGQSVNIYNRWSSHKGELNRNCHCNGHLQNSWNKYGENNFAFYIIEQCLKDDLCDKEKYYISKLPAGFEQTQYGETDNSISVFYSNGKKGILFDQNVKGDHKIYMDNERTDFTKIEIDGQEYLLFESDTDVTCIWDNGRYILSISSNLDKETVIDLCKSTKLQK